MHSRKKIRLAMYNMLQAHPLLTALFSARTKPTDESRVPFANIVTGPEQTEDLSDQWIEKRTVQVYVRLYVVNDASVVDLLDDLAEAVETLLGADQTLGGACSQMRYKGCDPDYDSAAEQEVALLTMNYECTYLWEPSPAGDDLEVVQVSIDMSSPRNEPQIPHTPDGQIDASATINVPQ